jgi:hypothetical protein
LELRDIFVTPLVIIVVLMVAYFIRPSVTDKNTRRYFYPALFLKICAALALGIIYQFYYSGGDTFNYHTHGSRIIWEAFSDDFSLGFKLLFSNGELIHGTYKYTSRILFYSDLPSFAVVRVASFFDLFTFSTYSATAVLFSVISFIGGWAMFLTFYKKYPHLHFRLAIATLFIPSVIFWGSGILKDSIVLACLGIAVYAIDQMFFQRRVKVLTLLSLILTLYTIFIIRKFVLQAFIPSIALWVYFNQLIKVRSMALKILIAPLIVSMFLFTAYYSVNKVGEGDNKYSVTKLAETAKITAYDIGFYTGANAGSSYSLGEFDSSFSSMLQLAPQAINVALFRPYPWEVRNPLMVLSALESLFFLVTTIYLLMKIRFSLKSFFRNADTSFCFIFAITFAFAVGISSYNFGTLDRYKIPLLPFYLLWLILTIDKRSNKVV